MVKTDNIFPYIIKNKHYLHLFFFFNDTATTEIYTLSLHDALPIYVRRNVHGGVQESLEKRLLEQGSGPGVSAAVDRKSTRLNSSHSQISYAVFCLKKKKNQYKYYETTL